MRRQALSEAGSIPATSIPNGDKGAETVPNSGLDPQSQDRHRLVLVCENPDQALCQLSLAAFDGRQPLR
jgi:hypothetical protein